MSRNYVRVGVMQNLGHEFASEFNIVQKKKYHYVVSEEKDKDKVTSLVKHFMGVLSAIDEGSWLHYNPTKDRKVLFQTPSVCSHIDGPSVIHIHDFESILADRVKKSNGRMAKGTIPTQRRRKSSISDEVIDTDSDDDQELWQPNSQEDEDEAEGVPNPELANLYVIKIISVKMKGYVEVYSTLVGNRLSGDEKTIDLQDWEISTMGGDEEMDNFQKDFM